MFRWRALGLRIFIVTLLVLVAVYGSLWAYVEYKAHLVRVMLDEVSRVRVGDAEASILPLVQRYRGLKWTQPPLGPREDSLDKDEYDYRQNRWSGYSYELEVSPFGTTTLRPSRFTRAMRAARAATPPHLRPVLGMRNWGVIASLSIRAGRVQSVRVTTLFESRSGSLGHLWELAQGMPHHDLQPRSYVIGSAFLTAEDSGGMMITNYFTPEASTEEANTARHFNTRCLTSIKGCDGFCDVAPSAIEYLKRHPDAKWGIIPPKCPDSH